MTHGRRGAARPKRVARLLRNTLRAIRMWSGLCVGIILFCVVGSGALLVFEGPIDRAVNPRLWRVPPAREPLPLDTIVARVTAEFPTAIVSSIGLSGVPGRAWTIGAGSLTLFVDPSTGAIRGARETPDGRPRATRFVRRVHVELLAGRAGRVVVGVTCALGLLIVIAGVLRPRRAVKAARGPGRMLHMAAALVLVVVMSSGMLIYNEWTGRLADGVDPAAPAPVTPPTPVDADVPRASLDAIGAAARGALPDAEITRIVLGTGGAPTTVAMRFPGDRTSEGRSRVAVDPFTGAVLSAVDARGAPFGTRIDELKRSLHTGEVLGTPTRVLWLLAMLVLLAQLVDDMRVRRRAWRLARRVRRSSMQPGATLVASPSVVANTHGRRDRTTVVASRRPSPPRSRQTPTPRLPESPPAEQPPQPPPPPP